MYALIVWLLYYVIFGVALNRFINASVSNAVFDRFINSRIEGAKVNQGLNLESDDDEEEEEEDDIRENSTEKQ